MKKLVSVSPRVSPLVKGNSRGFSSKTCDHRQAPTLPSRRGAKTKFFHTFPPMEGNLHPEEHRKLACSKTVSAHVDGQ